MGAKQAHEQQMDESEMAHLSELAELRGRVMELQTKDSHTPDELAELDMLRSRVLGFQVCRTMLCSWAVSCYQRHSTADAAYIVCVILARGSAYR